LNQHPARRGEMTMRAEAAARLPKAVYQGF
jgi:hypothetical protein